MTATPVLAPPKHRAGSPPFADAEQALLDAGISFRSVAHCAFDACEVCSAETLRKAA